MNTAKCETEPGCHVLDFPRLAGIEANLTSMALPHGQNVDFVCQNPDHIMFLTSTSMVMVGIGNSFKASCPNQGDGVELKGVYLDAVCKPATKYNFINVNLVRSTTPPGATRFLIISAIYGPGCSMIKPI